MSYLVLARKFRPQRFEEIVGQGAVVRTLQNALSRNRVAHAMIFSGVRGTGKTTLARIMAKALNCEQGPTPTPCNHCLSCSEIMTGTSVDLHEIDGASNRGIQEIRELKDKIRFMPTSSRYQIIIIDEVHMLTTEAFNALLKTLEEPPAHVFFLFATTELHRLPVTILSRCQRYELKRVGHRELFQHFTSLAEKENISIEPAALNVIVREAGGSVRDGLSLLDQIFSYCGDTVSAVEVVDVLGLVGHQVIAEIGSLLLWGDLASVLNKLEQVYNHGLDLKRFINDLLDWLRSLTICKISKQPENLLDLPSEEIVALQEVAAAYSAERLYFAFNTMLDHLEKVTFSARPRFMLEMAFIKTVQLRDIVPVSDILGKLEQVLAGIPLQESSRAGAPVYGSESSAAFPPSLAEKKNSVPLTGKEVARKGDAPPVLPAQGGPAAPHHEGMYTAPLRSDLPAQSAPTAAAVNNSAQNKKKDVRLHWQDFTNYVKERKVWMAAALQRAASVRLEKDILTIQYNDRADFRLLNTAENIKPLTEFALDFFQENFRIQFKAPDAAGGVETSGESESGPQRERRDLANESLVRTALEIFNGQIGDIRIGPRFRKPLTRDDEDEFDGSDDHESLS